MARGKVISKLLEQPAYAAIRTVLTGLGVCDMATVVGCASSIGRWFATRGFNRKRLKRAIENLEVAFPEWDDPKRREYAIKAYEHLLTLAVETTYAPRLLSDDGWSQHLSLGGLGKSAKLLLESRAAGRPTVMITGHCGNWELLGYSLSLLGFPSHALYRPLDLKPMDDWVRSTRERRGLVLVDKFGAVEDLPALMKAGGAASFVADQNAGDRGLFVPFFGRLASTYKTIGLLAIQYRTPVVCGFARRLVWERDGGRHDPGSNVVGFAEFQGEPLRYAIESVDVIAPEDWEGQPDPLFYITARYRRAIETAVRRAPEQYLWMHRYWKSRPRHERLGRPFPGALREKLEQLPWMTGEELARIMDWSERDAAACREEDRGAGAGRTPASHPADESEPASPSSIQG